MFTLLIYKLCCKTKIKKMYLKRVAFHNKKLMVRFTKMIFQYYGFLLCLKPLYICLFVIHLDGLDFKYNTIERNQSSYFIVIDNWSSSVSFVRKCVCGTEFLFTKKNVLFKFNN